METPFKQVTLVDDDIITIDVLNTIQNNMRWVSENTPRSRMYMGDSTRGSREHMSILVCGRVYIGRDAKSNTANVRVNFGSFFDPTCVPNVTTGIINTGTTDIFCVLNGRGSAMFPDATGFEIVTGMAGAKKISKAYYVNWQAHGYARSV